MEIRVVLVVLVKNFQLLRHTVQTAANSIGSRPGSGTGKGYFGGGGGGGRSSIEWYWY